MHAAIMFSTILSASAALRGHNSWTIPAFGTPTPNSKYPHAAVSGRIIDAFAHKEQLPKLSELMCDDSDVTFCYPYPNCVSGKAAMRAFLLNMSSTLIDSVILPVAGLPSAGTQPFQDTSGGLWASSTAFSFKKAQDNSGTCLVDSSDYFTWEFSKDKTCLSNLRTYFDEKGRFDQLQACDENVVHTLMMGGGPDKNAETNIAMLGGLYDDLLATQFAVSADRITGNGTAWAASWVSLMAQTGPIKACGPYPACFEGPTALEGLRQDFVDMSELQYQTTFSNSVNFVVGTSTRRLAVSKNVGFSITEYSFLHPKTGCLNSHLQFTTIELSPTDPTKLSSLETYYANDTHDVHKC